MPFLNLYKDEIVLTFKYDPRIVAVVKTIPGRKYRPVSRAWVIPAVNARECVETLAPLGFTPTLDVLGLLERQKAVEGQLEVLKTDPALYVGDLPLYDFQKIGASFLSATNGALLADAPGLGKTIQTIAALEMKHNRLVLCPASLKYNWADEIMKWTPGESVWVVGGKASERQPGWLSYVGWTVANYELLRFDYDAIKQHEIDHGPWEAIICDEATRIQNPLTKTAKILKTLNTEKKIALTGTPVSNSPLDMYGIIDWLSPGYLGSFWQFRDRYCVYNGDGIIVGYANLEEFGKRVRRFMLRRTKEEVLKNFPRKSIVDISIDLSGKERKYYTAILKNIREQLERTDIQRNLNIIPVKLLRLKQFTGYPPAIFDDCSDASKLAALRDLIEPIAASGEKVLVFTQFAEMAKVLYGLLGKYSPRLISGSVSVPDRERAVKEFSDPQRSSSVLISTEAGAYGLNLQAASYVIHYDAPWSVAKLMQREDRAHRIGQTKPVTVYNLICRNTIDEYVLKVLHKKQVAAVEILEDKERLEQGGFSEDDIRAILRI